MRGSWGDRRRPDGDRGNNRVLKEGLEGKKDAKRGRTDATREGDDGT